MQIIDKGRGCGKTTQIVLLSAKTQYPILCKNNMDKLCILDRAKEFNINIPTPILWSEYSGQNTPYVLIDEAFLFLEYLLKTNNPEHQGIFATSFSSETYQGNSMMFSDTWSMIFDKLINLKDDNERELFLRALQTLCK